MNYKKLIKRVIPKPLIRQVHTVVRMTYMKSRRLSDINTTYDLSWIGEEGVHTFFGYYDISPFDKDDNVIYHEVDEVHGPAKIIKNSLDGKTPQIVASTNAWNTQQGARLRWMPCRKDVISFNDYENGQYFNRQLNVVTGEEVVTPFPLYDISPDGKIGLSINFERLGVMRPGYGYTNRKYVPTEDLSKEDIKVLNIANGKVLISITYSEIAKAIGVETSDFSKHYLNHLSFSPKGDKFLFFWLKEVPTWIEASLVVYDLKTKKMSVLEKEYRVSHYTWLDNDTILCTGLKQLPNDKFECCYFKYHIGTNRQQMGKDILVVDGHPTRYNDSSILSDTYPDRYSFQELFLYDGNADKKRKLVYSYSIPVKNAEYRTDMHPRFNADKSIICYDANVTGFRHLYFLKNWEE